MEAGRDGNGSSDADEAEQFVARKAGLRADFQWAVHGPASVNVGDDDHYLLQAMARTYRHQSFDIFTTTSAEEAMFIIKSRTIGVIVADEQMPGMSGGELLAWVANNCPEVMRIVLTGQPTVESTIRAINKGRVFHFFTKPCNPADLAMAIHRATEYKDTLRGNLQQECK